MFTNTVNAAKDEKAAEMKAAGYVLTATGYRLKTEVDAEQAAVAAELGKFDLGSLCTKLKGG